jgi:hypothetical protein
LSFSEVLAEKLLSTAFVYYSNYLERLKIDSGRRFFMKNRFVIIIFVLLLFITSCSKDESNKTTTTIPGKTQPQNTGGSSSGSGETEKQMIMPEQLISKEEATELIGEPVKDGVKEQQPLLGLNICFYAAEAKDSKSYLQIALIQKEAMSSGQSGDQSGQSGGQSGQSGSQSGQSGQSGGQSGGSGGSEGEMSPKTLYEGLKKLFSDPNTAITGRVGEDTFISAQGMSILSGEYYIYVAIGNSDPQKMQTILKQAGETAEFNLKRIQGE